MKKILIFGAGGFGKEIYEKIRNKVDVIGFLDNDLSKIGQDVDGVKILGNAQYLSNIEYDEVIVGTMALTIVDQLIEVGVPRNLINTEYINVRIYGRLNFLYDFAGICDYNENLCVAEGGVFQGEFAEEINKAFPKSKLLLFDSFEGFDERDIQVENKKSLSVSAAGYFGYTDTSIVLNKMTYPDNVLVYKGYFPDSTKDVDENNKYIFVNLDFDLYNPTLQGLRYFYPKMVKGGCILVHDYFHMNYKGVPQAIKDFETEIGYKLKKMPIGDHCSIAIIL
jgi:hypothetical protein